MVRFSNDRLDSDVSVDDFLEFFLLLEAAHSFNDFSAFEKQNGWDGRDAVLHCQLHAVCDIELSNFGSVGIVGCQLVDDWTQSFAGRSAVGVKVYQYRSIRTEHLGIERFGIEFNCHLFLLY